MNTRHAVLDPARDFDTLARDMAQAGWRLAGRAEQPLLPGEPEHAVFEHATGGRWFYSFNPVCRLRVADLSGLHDAATLPALHAVDAARVRDWLAGDDERAVLRGLLAAVQLADPALLPPVEAQRRHPHAAIARAAERASGELRGRTPDTPADARVQALATIELLRQQLTPLLQALPQDRDSSLTATLRPRPEDYGRAFRTEAAALAQAAYAEAWSLEAPRVSAVQPDSQLRIALAPAGMLADDNALSRHFPGGYRSIAHLLDPPRVWVRWKYLRPGETTGLSYDGLVWLDDHWVWFPKPYRVLAP